MKDSGPPTLAPNELVVPVIGNKDDLGFRLLLSLDRAVEESRVRAQVAEGSAFGPDRTRRLPCRAPGPAAPGRARGGTAAGGGSRSPHSCGCGSSPLSRPSLLGGGKWRVGVTECDCPRPLLPERESAIKAPLRPALHTPSASSQRSGRHAGQLSPRRPPRPPAAAVSAASPSLPGAPSPLPGAAGRWEGRAPAPSGPL